uniref:Uncharacterized protein n=1 Tax=Parascaris equorum TaxID=6256 RepID=A0A914RRZ5_PAREQ
MVVAMACGDRFAVLSNKSRLMANGAITRALLHSYDTDKKFLDAACLPSPSDALVLFSVIMVVDLMDGNATNTCPIVHTITSHYFVIVIMVFTHTFVPHVMQMVGLAFRRLLIVKNF